MAGAGGGAVRVGWRAGGVLTLPAASASPSVSSALAAPDAVAPVVGVARLVEQPRLSGRDCPVTSLTGQESQ